MTNKLLELFHKTKVRREKEKRYINGIQNSPWKDDIHIDRSSFIGSGAYNSAKGKEYHTVYCAADGPNPDGTMHHQSIGYWKNFQSFEEANEFTTFLWDKIRDLIGRKVSVYASANDKNNHAAWCIGEKETRPSGIEPSQLSTNFLDYSH